MIYHSIFSTSFDPQVGYDKKEDFKKSMQAHKLSAVWDQAHKMWFGSTLDPVTIAEVVADGYEVLENPHET